MCFHTELQSPRTDADGTWARAPAAHPNPHSASADARGADSNANGRRAPAPPRAPPPWRRRRRGHVWRRPARRTRSRRHASAAARPPPPQAGPAAGAAASGGPGAAHLFPAARQGAEVPAGGDPPRHAGHGRVRDRRPAGLLQRPLRQPQGAAAAAPEGAGRGRAGRAGGGRRGGPAPLRRAGPGRAALRWHPGAGRGRVRTVLRAWGRSRGGGVGRAGPGTGRGAGPARGAVRCAALGRAGPALIGTGRREGRQWRGSRGAASCCAAWAGSSGEGAWNAFCAAVLSLSRWLTGFSDVLWLATTGTAEGGIRVQPKVPFCSIEEGRAALRIFLSTWQAALKTHLEYFLPTICISSDFPAGCVRPAAPSSVVNSSLSAFRLCQSSQNLQKLAHSTWWWGGLLRAQKWESYMVRVGELLKSGCPSGAALRCLEALWGWLLCLNTDRGGSFGSLFKIYIYFCYLTSLVRGNLSVYRQTYRCNALQSCSNICLLRCMYFSLSGIFLPPLSGTLIACCPSMAPSLPNLAFFYKGLGRWQGSESHAGVWLCCWSKYPNRSAHRRISEINLM